MVRVWSFVEMCLLRLDALVDCTWLLRHSAAVSLIGVAATSPFRRVLPYLSARVSAIHVVARDWAFLCCGECSSYVCEQEKGRSVCFLDGLLHLHATRSGGWFCSPDMTQTATDFLKWGRKRQQKLHNPTGMFCALVSPSFHATLCRLNTMPPRQFLSHARCCNNCVPENIQAMLMREGVPDKGPFGLHPETDQIRIMAEYGC